MILSILILTLKERELFFNSLVTNLKNQIGVLNIEILSNDNQDQTIGEKRNELLQRAKGKYLCFFDDDDTPSDNYINTLVVAIATNPDCISLRGKITTNGVNPETFEHSLKYNEWRTTDNEIKYERYPNHLNCIKSDIAKQILFPEKSFGEDFDWSKKLHESGLLKKEYYTDNILYYYNFVSNK